MKIIQHGRLRVEFDAREIDKDNPGNGTPEMVYVTRGGRDIASATLACAQDTGECAAFSVTGADVILTESENRFLNGTLVESERDAFWLENP